VIRYAILYFTILVVFIALIAGPIVAGKYIKFELNLPLPLIQPTGLNNNDTRATATGSCVHGDCPGPGGGSARETDTADSRRFARYVAF
jgi:1,3-beta-glucan synthase